MVEGMDCTLHGDRGYQPPGRKVSRWGEGVGYVLLFCVWFFLLNVNCG